MIEGLRALGHTLIVESEDGSSSAYPPIGFEKQAPVPRRALDGYVLLAYVRNPYAFLVSYAGHAGGWNEKYSGEHYDRPLVEKGFDYLVRTLADRDEEVWPNRRLLFFPLFSDGGDLVADWIGRTETLFADAEAFAAHVGVRFTPKPSQRVGKHEDYRSYYSDDLRELVARTWARDIDLFGYDFDGVSDSADALVGPVSDSTKAKVRYLWSSDQLWTRDESQAGSARSAV
jgi:hypothetical protein